ncbi:monoglyceride lipase-like isoform X2 [Heptranchias perlo]|uniref:monoglyceride lipase-like isoform X2 n=1 Tax=Heptranchias perlo TaxID=212740 RepID=UPI00355A11BB
MPICCCFKKAQKGEDRMTPQGLFYKDLPHFINADGNYLFCRYWEPPTPPRALVMIVHSAGEHSGRYSEVVSLLLKHSLYVFAHDHVGHGQSEGEGMMVSHFGIYVRDTLQHIDMMKRSHPHLRIYLFSTSMGGLISLYVANERQNDIAGMIFIAPLVLMNPESATFTKMFCARLLKNFLPQVALGYMDPRSVSRDEEKVIDYIRDPLNYHGPVRVRFATEVLHALIKLEKILPTISTPMLILHGDADKLSDVRGSYIMYGKVASLDKTLKVYEHAAHQLHRELPSVTEEVFKVIDGWLEERLPPIEQ